MNDIITVAQSTFYRIARMKSLYIILAICIMDVAAMSRYKDLSLGMEKELMVDAALAILTIIAVISAMVAAFEIPRELRDKSATYILSKPSGRNSYVWGKFLGIAGLVVFNTAVVLVGSLAAYRLSFGETPWHILPGGILVMVEGVTLTGIALLLSILLADHIAAVCTFACFAVGHAVCMLPRKWPNALADAVYYVLPNFKNLDVKTAISHGVEVHYNFVGYGVAYGLCYALAMAGLANVVFSRKDLQ